MSEPFDANLVSGCWVEAMKAQNRIFYCLFALVVGCQTHDHTNHDSEPHGAAHLDTMAAVQSAAQQGNANAQYVLGAAYWNGQAGMPKDMTKACYWLLKSAQGGNAEAQCEIAGAYLGGAAGFQTDYSEGIKWLHRAIDQGNASAKAALGFCYAEGNKGLPQDYKEAVKWYLEAANAGDAN